MQLLSFSAIRQGHSYWKDKQSVSIWFFTFWPIMLPKYSFLWRCAKYNGWPIIPLSQQWGNFTKTKKKASFHFSHNPLTFLDFLPCTVCNTFTEVKLQVYHCIPQIYFSQTANVWARQGSHRTLSRWWNHTASAFSPLRQPERLSMVKWNTRHIYRLLYLYSFFIDDPLLLKETFKKLTVWNRFPSNF